MKFELIDQAVKDYGFVLLGRGTNRCIYKHQMDEKIVLKIGFDRSGAGDSLKEVQNMMMLRPFVTKCFDVSPSGGNCCDGDCQLVHRFCQDTGR